MELLDDDFPAAPRPSYLLCLATCARSLGFATGIRWGLSESMSAAIDRALAAGDWQANVVGGPDSCRVQPMGMSYREANHAPRPTAGGPKTPARG